MSNDDVTLGEIKRGMESVSNKLDTLTAQVAAIATTMAADQVRYQALDDRVAKLEETQLTFVPIAADHLRHQHIMDRLSKLEANQAKLAWLVITAVVGAVLGLVLIP